MIKGDTLKMRDNLRDWFELGFGMSTKYKSFRTDSQC